MNASFCTSCGQSVTGMVFCTQCGTPTSLPTGDAAPQASPTGTPDDATPHEQAPHDPAPHDPATSTDATRVRGLPPVPPLPPLPTPRPLFADEVDQRTGATGLSAADDRAAHDDAAGPNSAGDQAGTGTDDEAWWRGEATEATAVRESAGRESAGRASATAPASSDTPYSEAAHAPAGQPDRESRSRTPLWIALGTLVAGSAVVGGLYWGGVLEEDPNRTASDDSGQAARSGEPDATPQPGGAGTSQAGTTPDSTPTSQAPAASTPPSTPPSTPGPAPEGPAKNLSRIVRATAPVTAPPGVDLKGKKVTYGAANMLDGSPGTAWRMVGDGTGTSLTFTFPDTVRLDRVGLVNGYAKTSSGVDWYRGNRRTLVVRWTFDDGTSVRQRLDSTRSLQTVDVDATTRSVRLTLLKVSGLSGPKKAQRNNTALSEVRFTGAS